MFASKFKTVLLTSILALSAASAQADVITFEGIAATNDYVRYESGSTLFPLSGYALQTIGNAFVVGGAFYQNSGEASNGTSFLLFEAGRSVTLTSTVQPLFSVQSIDLANVLYNGDALYNSTATLTGTFANGTSIVTSYLLSNNNIVSTNDFTTKLLSGYTNLTSFSISASGYILAVDNIVLTQGATATAAVPEPASLAILGLGLVGIGAARRRKSA